MIRRPPRSTLSLHDALPISVGADPVSLAFDQGGTASVARPIDRLFHRSVDGDGIVSVDLDPDRKSTRLNSSHVSISYAVFCLKKKKKQKKQTYVMMKDYAYK